MSTAGTEITSCTLDNNSPPPMVTTSKPREPMLGRGLACLRCRTRKQRCDGAQSSCTPCVLAASDCQYIQVPKVSKPKPRATATEGLEEKVSRLQREFEELQAALNVHRQYSPESTATASLTSHSSMSPPPDCESDGNSTTSFPLDPKVAAFRDREMPDEDRDAVIRIFFTGSQRLGCPILPDRFFRRLADDDPQRRPHPALINAMLLVGVAFTWWTPGYSTAKVADLPPTTPSAEILLARTQLHLNDSLGNMDRLLDHLQAAILLSYFFFQQGRLEEGGIISASNSKMAIVCLLDRIDQNALDEMRPGATPLPFGQSMWDSTFLGRPQDSYELGIRIWTFWQAWYYDAVFSIIAGTPRVRSAERPTTVFPRRSQAYESGVAFNLHHHSFEELFQSSPSELIKPSNDPKDVIHPLGTYLKGVAILDRSQELMDKLRRTGINNAQVYISEVNRLHSSLQILASEHLPILEEDLMASHTLSPQDAARLYCPLSERIVGHILLHTATIQICRLTRTLEFESEAEREVYLSFVKNMEADAANGAVRALKIFGEEVRKLSLRMQGYDVSQVSVKAIAEIQEHPCLLLSFLLTTVCLVLVDRIKTLRSSPDHLTAVVDQVEAESDLQLAVATMQHTAKSFPLLNIQIEKIYAYRRAVDGEAFQPPQQLQWEYERRLASMFN